MALAWVLAAGGVDEEVAAALLLSNEIQRQAHLAGDAQLLASQIGESMISIGDGEISRATREAIEQRFEGYFRAVRYQSWDDMRPPVIEIADDGSLAMVAVQKLVALQAVAAAGEPGPMQFVQFAWDATYRQHAGRWLLVATSSTRKMLDAEQAAAAPIAMSAEFATIREPDLVPEGVAHDPVSGTTFVSSTYRRKIVAIDSAGQVRDFKSEGEDGLWSTLGMEADPTTRSLWVVSANLHEVLPMRLPQPETEWQSQLLRFDIDSGQLMGRFQPQLSGQTGLNDVTVTDDGRVFATESVQGQVLEVDLAAGLLRPLALDEALIFPNGITHDDKGRLYVAHRQGIRVLDPVSGAQQELRRPAEMRIEGFDGLAWYDRRLIGNQPQRQRILELTLADDGEQVLSQRILEANHPAFDQPSTGEVIVETDAAGQPQARFVYLANAQMRSAFDWRDDDAGVEATRLKRTDELAEILLLQVRLASTVGTS